MSKKQYAIGIDLGTSTSEICLFSEGKSTPVGDPSSSSRSPIMPSLVGLTGRGEMKVGWGARNYQGSDWNIAREVKRLMGSGEMVQLADKQYRPEEISAVILKQLKQNAESAYGIKVEDVVLSVPANFPDAARQATLDAGKLAGLNILRLINEPTAAALAYGIKNLDREEQLLIFDFGGGTLDITILEMVEGVMDVHCSYGDPKLGGKDFDKIMIELVLKKFKSQFPKYSITKRQEDSLKNPAEDQKILLSGSNSCVVFCPNFAIINGEPVDLEVEITRKEFENASAELIDKARLLLKETLKRKEIRPSSIDRVLLVGGTTYIPAVRNMVAEIMGKEPRAEVDPDLAVAIGTSVQAAIIGELVDSDQGIILTDVCPYGLGIDTYFKVFGQWKLMYNSLMPPNTTYPYTADQVLSLMYPDQEELIIRLFQDHKGKAKVPEDAIYTGKEAVIYNIPHSPTDIPHEILVHFSYDINGIVTLTATIPATNQRVTIDYTPNKMRLDWNREAQQSLLNVDNLWSLTPEQLSVGDITSTPITEWEQSPRAKEYEAILRKAEKILTELHNEKKQELQAMLNELKQALVDNNAGMIEHTSGRLIDYLFNIDF